MRKNWTETTLGDAVTVQKGKKPPALVASGESSHPYLTADVLRGATCEQFVPDELLGPCIQLNGRETVLLWDGAGAGDVFRSQLGVLASTMAKLVARDSHLIDDGYLFLFLNSKQTTIKSSCRGTTVPHVSPEALVSLKLPLPPLIEQERIVDLVSSVDSYIFALQQQADAAHAARSAVLSELLSAGGDDWIETTLGETLEIARGGSPRPIRDFITSEESGVNWVKIGDASASSKYIYRTEQKIRQDGVSRSRPVKVGDFILSNSMSFGRPYIMRTDGCIHDGWLLFSKVEDHFDEDFLYNLLMSDSVQTQFDSLAAGSGVRNLNIEVVGEVRISLPPLDLQREIAEVANSLDAYVLAIEQSIVDSTRLRVGLLTDLLSGEHEIPESYDRLLGAA
jgi:type I restriction enzyme S subunit